MGAERQLGSSISVAVSYVYVHTLRLPVAIDTNALAAPITQVPGPSGQPVAMRNWNTSATNPTGVAPCAGAAVFTCFANPLLLQNNVYSSAGSALYHGAIFEVKKRFSDSMTLMGSYTVSRAQDTTTDFNSDFGPFDQTNLAGERALSDFDQRHKIVVAAVMNSPWKSSDNPAQRLLSGFQFAPIIRYNSGHPFNNLAGTDVNGDRHSTNDRPLGVGRNAGQGPDYFDVDLRLSRGFKITERASVNFIAEAFNIFNRTNFVSLNNVNPAPTGSLRGFEANPLDSPIGINPFEFASAALRRQLQFGVRLAF